MLLIELGGRMCVSRDLGVQLILERLCVLSSLCPDIQRFPESGAESLDLHFGDVHCSFSFGRYHHLGFDFLLFLLKFGCEEVEGGD